MPDVICSSGMFEELLAILHKVERKMSERGE